MGFATQLILLAILGIYSHYAYIYKGKKAKNEAWVARYSMWVVFLIFLFGILMYTGALNFLIEWINEIPWIEYSGGQHFMWDSGMLFGLSSGLEPSGSLHGIAVFLFLSYLPWYYLAKSFSQLMFGGRLYQKGMWYALEPVKRYKKGEH